jgi:hypothetical protein
MTTERGFPLNVVSLFNERIYSCNREFTWEEIKPDWFEVAPLGG